MVATTRPPTTPPPAGSKKNNANTPKSSNTKKTKRTVIIRGRGKKGAAKKNNKKAPAKKKTQAKHNIAGDGTATGAVPKKTRTPNYSKAEDVILAKAFVNVSENPITGNDQKAGTFWANVCKKFYDMAKENDVAIPVNRTTTSLTNRFQKQLQKNLNEWNAFYKQIKDSKPSGTTEEDMRNMADELYSEMNDARPFNFRHVVDTLHQMPKFNPMHEDYNLDDMSGVGDDDDDADATTGSKTNNNKAPMGSAMERPMGSKKAKQQLKDSVSLLSIASQRAKTLEKMAKSGLHIAKVMQHTAKMQSMSANARMYLSIGHREEGLKIMEELKILQMQNNIEEEEEGEEENIGGGASLATTNSMPTSVEIGSKKVNNTKTIDDEEEDDDDDDDDLSDDGGGGKIPAAVNISSRLDIDLSVPASKAAEEESAAFWARRAAKDAASDAKAKGIYDRAMRRGVVDIHESSSDSNEEIEMVTTSEDEE